VNGYQVRWEYSCLNFLDLRSHQLLHYQTCRVTQSSTMLSQMSHVEPPRKRAKTSGDQIGAHTKSDIEQFSRKGAPGSNVKLENMEHQNQGRGNEGSMGRNASSQGTVSEPSEVNFPTSSLQGVSDGINESLVSSNSSFEGRQANALQ
jgi:hypothetical protein